MYLRLKSRACKFHRATDNEPHDGSERTLNAILLKRHYGSFDWAHGGQRQALKFIDSHQLEFAVRSALAGDFLSRLMADLYNAGIQRLIGPAGGACQYSAGPVWNDDNRFYTLAGQAVALQAVALTGLLSRHRAALHLGLGINRFVETACGRTPRAGGSARHVHLFSPDRVRDNAWYAIAMDQFGAVFDRPELRRAARLRFADTLAADDRRETMENEHGYRADVGNLDDMIAVAGAAYHFAGESHAPDYMRRATAGIVKAAARYRHPGGGYCQSPRVPARSDEPIDIDCTIELTRIAYCLAQYDPDPSLVAIARDGNRSLSDPCNAFERNPECGILLLQHDLRFDGPRTAPAAVAGHKAIV